MAKNSGRKKCCICGGYFYGPENNPSPVMLKGVCCDSCNLHVVIPARLQIVLEFRKKKQEGCS